MNLDKNFKKHFCNINIFNTTNLWISGVVLLVFFSSFKISLFSKNIELISTSNLSFSPSSFAITVAIGPDTSICQGEFLLLTPTISGDPGPYSYQWNNGLGTVANPLVNPIVTTIYTVTVSDGLGSTATDQIQVIVNDNPFVTAGTDSLICEGESVNLSASAVGGDGSYTFEWDNGLGTGANKTVSPVVDVTYVVTVTDGNGCSDIDSINISVNATLIGNAGSDVTIYGGENTNLIASGTGGSGSYSYTWSGGLGLGAVKNVSPLTTTTYTVTVTDGYSCTDTDEVIVTVEPPLTVNAGTDVEICNSENTTLTASASDGSGAGYSYVWSNGLGAGVSHNVSPSSSTIYTVTATDSDGNTATDQVLVTINPLPIADAGVSSDFCLGENFTLLATASGGDGSYTYTWDNSLGADSSHIVSPAVTTTYSVTVTDGKTCTDTDEITITPISVSVDAGLDISICSGDTTTLTAVGSGSDGFYTYTWSDGLGTSASVEVNPIAITTYTVTITDGLSCTSTDQVTVSIFTNAPVITPSADLDICIGENTSLSASTTGGVGTLTYTWSDGLGTGIPKVVSPLSTTTYSVTVEDSNGCQDVGQIEITVDNLPTVSASVTSNFNGEDISCNGISDGTALANPSGQTPFSYAWSNGATTALATGLGAGTYTVVVTDGNSCTASDTVTLTEPTIVGSSAAVTSNYNGAQIRCFNGNDGEVTATPSGGTTPYSYIWNDASNQTSMVATNLVAGTYTVTVSDANGCTSSSSVVISEPNELTVSISKNDVSCVGGNYGDATAIPADGTTPYAYAWSSGGSAVLENNLIAGTYTVTITDANGCTAFAETTLIESSALSISTTSSDATCAASDGSATVTASGAVSYTYTWSTGGSGTTENSLGAGTYTVTVLDNFGCTATETVNISAVSNFAITISGTDISCDGGSDGTITVGTVGGAPTYNYAWSDAAINSATRTGLTAGTYTVTVTDGNSCQAIESITLSEPTALAITGSSEEVSCNVFLDGEASVAVIGGTFPYTYSWSNGGSTPTITGLAANTYTVTATDNNGCQITESVVVGEPSVVTASFSNNEITCNGFSDGTSTVTPSGGTTPYSYLWSNGSNSATVTGLSATTYTVTITDGNGCVNSFSTTLTEPSILVASASITSNYSGFNISCIGYNDGTATASESGGTSPYTYAWSNGETTSNLINVTAGTYTVTISDANNCTATSSVNLTEPTGMTLSTNVTSDYNGLDISCAGAMDGSGNVIVSGGGGSYTYSWNNGETTASISGLDVGTYVVTVTDGNLCTATATMTLQLSPLSVSANITSDYNGEDVSCVGSSDGRAMAIGADGAGGYLYQWSTGATTAIISGLSAGTYTVTTTDANGCTSTASVNLNNPAALTVAPAVTSNFSGAEISCYGAIDGVIAANAAGGATPYFYQWSNSTSAATISGIGAGTYSVTVTDANGCSVIGSVPISEPIELTAVATVTSSYNGLSVSCFGASDGTALVTPSGGTSGYTYNWTSGHTVANPSGLSAGTYTVTATDANGCSVISNITLTEPDGMTAEAIVITNYNGHDISCSSGSDGGITANPINGIAPHVYSWNNGATTKTVTGLSAGTYTVTITNDNGCTNSASISISDPPAMVVSFSKTNFNGSDISCVGASDGELTANISNGLSPYGYTWSDGQRTQTAKGLPAGTYTVTITDSYGCTVSASSTLSDPTPLSLSSAVTSNYLGFDISCNGGSDGIALATPSGGSGAYTYLWSDGQTTASLTGASAETYLVTVTDGNGCTATSSVSFSEPTQFTVEITSNDLSDCDVTDGQILINASGGVGTFEYRLDNGAWQATNSYSGLSAGTYNIYVRNGLGTCETSAFNVSLDFPSTPVIGNITEINPTTASSNDGSILINSSGNGAIIEYRIVSITGWQSSNLISGLDEGTYTIEARYSGTDCIISSSVTLTAGDGIIGNSGATSICSNDVSGNQALETYYIPGAEDQILTSLQTIYNANPGCGTGQANDPVTTYVSIGVVEAGTIIYYDHWEDGYETDPYFPIQTATREIWGDGILTNGVAPGYPSDVFNASDNIILSNDVVTSTRGTVYDFDGGDKISSQGRLSITRLGWGAGLTIYMAGAVEVYPTTSWGNNFIVPVGEDADVNDLFEYTGALLMPEEDNTFIQIDADANGTFETSFYRDEGESYLINGGLSAGAKITSSNNIQVDLITGDLCHGFETRWFTLRPFEEWSDSYFNPVATANDGSNTHTDFVNAPTYVHLYNPNNTSIVVRWETSAGTQSNINISGNSTAVQELPDGTGSRFYTTNNRNFYALATIDSDAFGNNARNDWGYAMLPESALSGQITLVAFAPGGDPTTVSTENSSPIWVTAAYPQGDANTSSINICIDYDGDGGSNVDLNGQTYDELRTLNVLAQTKIFDSDYDNTSTRIWVCDGSNALIAGAWGQDPASVANEARGLDLGVGLPSGVPFDANKCVELLDDINGNGIFEECETVQYSINIKNTGVLPLSIGSFNILDTLPSGVTYIENTTTAILASGASVIADDNGANTPFPLDEDGLSYSAVVQPGDSMMITFNATINSIGASSFVRNVAYIQGISTTLEPEVTFLAQEPPTPAIPPIPPADITISCDDPVPVAPFSDTLSLVYNEVQTAGSCPHEYVLDRTWTITDDCGNVTVLQQFITVEDNTAPTLVGIPVDVTVSPDSIPSVPIVTAFDNCDASVTPVFSTVTNPALCNYAIERTWTATDDCGNIESRTQTITIVSSVDLTINIDFDYNGEDVSCAAGSNGGVTASVTGGTAPFGYTWSGGLGTGATKTGVAAGTYTVTVTDFTGCTISESITLTEPTAVVASSSVISNYNGLEVSCDGASDGIVRATGTGGIPGYTYQWSTLDNTPTASGLVAGTYTVTVTDANGCAATSEVTISNATPINPVASVISNYNGQEVSCIGSSDGIVSVSATGGTGSYSYVWSTGAITASTSGLIAGTYTVTVSDSNGCTSSSSVTVDNPPAIGVTTNKTSNHNGADISCVGASDGAADAAGSGGSGGYSYTWSNGQTGVNLTNVLAGTYTVTVTDNNGCTATNTVALSDPTDLSISLSITSNHNGRQISCVGASDGAISSTISNGTPGYTYAWNSGQTTPNISGISAGTYTLVVTDANDCTSSESITINDPIVLTASLSVTSDYNGADVSCTGATDGSVSASALGGTPGYTYAWSGGLGTGDVKTNLGAGTYTVTITDNNTCTSSASVTLSPPASLNVSTSVTQNLSCIGSTDGAGSSTVTGGIGSYAYAWSNGQNNNTITNVGIGTYTLTVTDGNGCTNTSSITFTNPIAISLSASVTSNFNGTPINCNGDSNGTATATASGGTGVLSYIWSNGQTTAGATGLSAGTYTVIVSDGNGCTSSTSVSLTEPQPVIADAGINQTICNGENANLSASATGGNSGYTFAWSNSLGSGANKTVSPTINTTYTVTVTDVNGCTDEDQITINVNNTPTADAGSNVTICDGENTTLIASATGAGGYSFVWSNGLGTGSTKTVTPISTTIYTVTVTDTNGCTDEDQVTVTVNNPIAIITSNSPICPADTINLSVTAADSYSWTGPNGFTSSIQNPMINTATLADSGVYHVTITDVAGCTSTTAINFVILFCAEDCTNGVDDDGDGDIDCDDSDCEPLANNAALNTCDNSNETGSGIFILHDVNPTVSTESGMMISYHPTLLDAQNATNILISPYSSADATVYARVERVTTGCFSTAQITLNVGVKCVENCNNGIDEDGDGLIDCDDPDCPCCRSSTPSLNDLNK